MNTVVYYPYLWPTPEWTRVAALCWDKVYVLGRRLGFEIVFPAEIDSLNTQLGGVLDTSLSMHDVLDDDLMVRFKSWVTAHEAALRASMVAEPQHLFRVFEHKFSFPPAPTETPLLDWLKERGLARIDHGFIYSDMGETVVHLPKDLGFHYLSLAAANAAQSGNRDLAADSSEFTDVVFHDARTARASVAMTTLEAHLPADFDRVEIARLAEVRADLAAARLRYQAAVGALVDELGAVASEGELARVQTAIEEIAADKVNETRAAYDRAKLKTAVEGVGVTVTPPAIATTVASALGIGIFAPAGVAMALSLFGAGAYLKWQEARAARAASPWSYVLDIASKTAPGPSRKPAIVPWDESMRTA